MGAYRNSLREEGSRKDLLRALEHAWHQIDELNGESVVPSMATDVERFNRELLGFPVPTVPTKLRGSGRLMRSKHLLEELQEFTDATTAFDQADALVDLVYVALGGLIQMGMCPGAAFEEVHRTNMLKRRGAQAKRPDSCGYDAVKPKGWTAPDLKKLLLVSLDDVDWLAEYRWMTDGPQAEVCFHVSEPEPMPKPKILVLGYARHGKDTVGEMLRDRYGLSFTSSSMFCAERVMMPYFRRKGNAEFRDKPDAIQDTPHYLNAQECFEDRANHRAEWYEAIRDFNQPDATALARAILEEHDVYCGIRSKAELSACRVAGVFDVIVWIDRTDHQPPEDRSSCTVEPWMADYVIDNNGTLEDLALNVERLATSMGLEAA